MGLNDRLFYLLLGAAIGFVLGYIVRSIREIEDTVNETGKFVKDDHSEDGFLKIPTMADVKTWFKRFEIKSVALLLVVLLSVLASFQSQRANHAVTLTQDSQAKIGYCNAQFLGKTIKALNERTTYSKSQTQANIVLQNSFLTFLKVLTFKPPKPQKEQEAAFFKYFAALNKFVDLTKKTSIKQEENPYPTVTEFTDCLDKPLSIVQKEVENQ